MGFFVVCMQVCIFHGSEVNHLSLFGPIFYVTCSVGFHALTISVSALLFKS